MKKILFLSVLAGGMALNTQAQQLPNGNFDEAWVECHPFVYNADVTSARGTQPQGWRISNVNGMSGTGATEVGSEDNTHTANGKAVCLTNTPNPTKKDQIVPAYFTLGTTWSTSYIPSFLNLKPQNNDGGTFGGVQFEYRPDAIAFDYKTNMDQSDKPMILAYLWSGSWSQADVPSEIRMSKKPRTITMTDRDRNILGIQTDQGGAITQTGVRIATINQAITAKSNDWETVTIPFIYENNDVKPEKFNVIFSAGNYFAPSNQVAKGITVSIDNVKLVYYSQLSALSVNGSPVSNFNKDTYSYEVDGDYTDGCIVATSNGKGASVTTTYDAANRTATVTVTGEDIARNATNKHVYTVSFKKAVEPAALESVSISGENFVDFMPNGTTFRLPYVYNPGYVITGTPAKGSTMVGDMATADDVTKTYSLKVYNSANDTTTYTFQFSDAVTSAESGEYKGALSVLLTTLDNYSQATPLANTNILVSKNKNNTYNLALNNFSFGGMLVGDIFVPNVALKNNKLEATRTIVMTSANPDAMGNSLGALPVKVAVDLLDTNAKHAAASIDIIVDGTGLAYIFAGIHVDFVGYTVDEKEPSTIGYAGAPYYPFIEATGRITKNTAKFLQINNHLIDQEKVEHNLPMTYIDLTKATIDADVTLADIMAGAPQVNNTLVLLPTGSKITGNNVVVDGKTGNVQLGEAADFHASTSFVANEVSFDRPFTATANYVSTFILPYELSVSEVQGKVYEFAGVANGVLNFKDVQGTIKANTPYVIVATTEKPFPTKNNVTIVATPAEMAVKVGDYAHVGSYTTQQVTSANDTVYYGYKGGAFVKANTGTLKPFRTMIMATTATAAAPAQFSLKLGNEVTGIIGVNSEIGKVNVYNLEGKLVRSQVEAATALQGLAKGVYVINGQKVVK